VKNTPELNPLDHGHRKGGSILSERWLKVGRIIHLIQLLQ
jgi:hypothetical protein